jgi:hypothetical protein
MDDAVKGFFGMLHEQYLKPRGYRKTGHNFHRVADGYTERIQFQGSAWNSTNGPWRFYANIGVEFQGLRVPTNRGFPRTHCWTRLKGIVARAPDYFDFQPSGAEPLACRLAKLLESASDTIARKQSRWRAKYRNSRIPYVQMR